MDDDDELSQRRPMEDVGGPFTRHDARERKPEKDICGSSNETDDSCRTSGLGHGDDRLGTGNEKNLLMEWDDYLLLGDDALEEHDVVNLRRSRLLVLSGTKVCETDGEEKEILTILTEEELQSDKELEKDREKMTELKKSPKTNKFDLKLLDLGKYSMERASMSRKRFTEMKQNFMEDIHTFQPTAIILPFLAVTFAMSGDENRDISAEINRKEESGTLLNLDGMDGFIGCDILRELRKFRPSLWQNGGLIFANRNFLIFRTRNMFQTNKTLLTSNTKTTTSGIAENVPKLLDYVKCWVGPKLIKILICYLVVMGRFAKEYLVLQALTTRMENHYLIISYTKQHARWLE